MTTSFRIVLQAFTLVGGLIACGTEVDSSVSAKDPNSLGLLRFKESVGSTSTFEFTNSSGVSLAVFGAVDTNAIVYLLPESYAVECLETHSNEWKSLPPVTGSWEKRERINIVSGETTVIVVDKSRHPTFASSACRLTVKSDDGRAIVSNEFPR
jgi:hypothetical protein